MIITDHNILETVSHDTSIEKCEAIGLWALLEAELKASKEPGAGLAAIQIGICDRAIYIEYKDYKLKMINPVIEQKRDPMVWAGEGCLSMPGAVYNTDRFNEIIIKWIDADEKKERRAVMQGFMAVLMQHEIDHLDGVLCYRREHHAKNVGRNDPCPCGSGKKYKKCCNK